MYDSSKMTIDERIAARVNYERYSVRNAHKVQFERDYNGYKQIYERNRKLEINASTSVFWCIHYLFDNKKLLKKGELSILQNININCLKWGKISIKQKNLIKRFAYKVQGRN